MAVGSELAALFEARRRKEAADHDDTDDHTHTNNNNNNSNDSYNTDNNDNNTCNTNNTCNNNNNTSNEIVMEAIATSNSTVGSSTRPPPSPKPSWQVASWKPTEVPTTSFLKQAKLNLRKSSSVPNEEHADRQTDCLTDTHKLDSCDGHNSIDNHSHTGRPDVSLQSGEDGAARRGRLVASRKNNSGSNDTNNNNNNHINHNNNHGSNNSNSSTTSNNSYSNNNNNHNDHNNSNSNNSSSSNTNNNNNHCNNSGRVASRKNKSGSLGSTDNSNATTTTTNNNNNNHSSSSSTTSSNSSGFNSTSTSHNLRRERILAKVRANNQMRQGQVGNGAKLEKTTIAANSANHNPIDDQGESSFTFHSSQINITSPTVDEVEMLFTDDSSYCDQLPKENSLPLDLVHPLVRNESLDSISNEIQRDCPIANSSILETSTTFHTTTSKEKGKQTEENSTVLGVSTPQKSKSSASGDSTIMSQQERLHLSSTPKIRGNYKHRRDDFERRLGVCDESTVPNVLELGATKQQVQMQQHRILLRGGIQIERKEGDKDSGVSGKVVARQEDHPSINGNHSPPSEQQHQQREQQHLHHPDDEKPHNIAQAYSLQERAPSTISAISGISIPSCFPQDSAFSHSQQQQSIVVGDGGYKHFGGGTTLINNDVIQESGSSYSTSRSNELATLNASNPSSTYSSQGGEGMGGSAFSPGIKNENYRLREQLLIMQKKLDEKDAIISQLMKRIADLENSGSYSLPATPRSTTSNRGSNHSYPMEHSDSHVMSSLWDRSVPSSDIVYNPHMQRSPTGDIESSLVMPSVLFNHAGMKQSPVTTSTATTSSSASVNTTSSYKSSRQASGSLARRRQSPRQRTSQSLTPNSAGDDRKFQC